MDDIIFKLINNNFIKQIYPSVSDEVDPITEYIAYYKCLDELKYLGVIESINRFYNTVKYEYCDLKISSYSENIYVLLVSYNKILDFIFEMFSPIGLILKGDIINKNKYYTICTNMQGIVVSIHKWIKSPSYYIKKIKYFNRFNKISNMLTPDEYLVFASNIPYIKYLGMYNYSFVLETDEVLLK